MTVLGTDLVPGSMASICPAIASASCCVALGA